VIHGILNALDELALDIFQATNVLPADVGNLDNSNFAEG
jgi:hypothetical protein